MLKFKSEYEDLQALVASTGIPGHWRCLVNGHFQFSSNDGAYLNWWATTGTITLQGTPAAINDFKLSFGTAVIGRRSPPNAQASLRPTSQTPPAALTGPAQKPAQAVSYN